MNAFETVTRKKLRFDSNKGQLTVEQLWSLPILGDTSLNAIGTVLLADIKATETESLVQTATADPDLKTRLEVVKRIIEVKQEEAKKATERRENKEKRDKIMRLIENKEDEKLSGASVEELKLQLAALD